MKPYYSDDRCTIYHGDALETVPELGSFDAVVTDPPYSSGARRDAGKAARMSRALEEKDWFSHDQMTAWGYSWFLRGLLREIRPHLEAGSHVYLFSDWRQTPNVYALLESVGLRVNHCLVWDKVYFGMGTYWRNQHENIIFASQGQPARMRQDKGTILKRPPVPATQRLHPTEKPIPLLVDIIDAMPGRTILDPFMGSGSTLRAAKNLGRQAVGIEIEERYCEIAAKRLLQEPMALDDAGKT